MKARIVTYFLVPSGLVVAVLSLLAFLVARDILEDRAIERLDVISNIKELELKLFIDEVQENLGRIADLPAIQEAAAFLLAGEESPNAQETYDTLERLVESAAAAAPELSEIFFLTDVGGRIFFSTDKAHEGGYRVTDSYYRGGLDGPVVQNVYPSAVTSAPTLTIATPLIDNRQGRLGVIAAHVSLEKLDRIVKDRTGLGSSGESYLVDALNVFVSAEGFGTEEFPRGVHSFGIDAAVNGESGAGTYRNYTDVSVIGVYRWIPERQLALLTEMHRSEATAPARRLSAVLGVIGVIAVGLLAVGAYFIARRIAEPILAVSETAVKIANGDLDQRAPVQTEDEVGVLAANFNVMTDRLRSTLGHLEAERERSDSLLLNVLPPSIADRLKDGEEPIVDSFSEVSVLFADIVDFTGQASRMSPVDMMSMLNRLFSAFDELSENHGVEKIKTVGDSYLVVGGLPIERPDHAEAIADVALDMQEVVARMRSEAYPDLRIRVGMNSGPLLAGVVGTKRFMYDIWGDTVNTASRMESLGIDGKTQVTENTYLLLREDYVFRSRGLIEVKGKRTMQTYFLKGKRQDH